MNDRELRREAARALRDYWHPERLITDFGPMPVIEIGPAFAAAVRRVLDEEAAIIRAHQDKTT